MKPINYEPLKTNDFFGCGVLQSWHGSCSALLRRTKGTVNIFYRENNSTSWQTVGYVNVDSETFLTGINYDPEQKIFTLSLFEGGESIKLKFTLSPLSKWRVDAQRVKIIGHDAEGVFQDLVIDREGGFGVIVKVDGSEDFYEVSPSDLIAIDDDNVAAGSKRPDESTSAKLSPEPDKTLDSTGSAPGKAVGSSGSRFPGWSFAHSFYVEGVKYQYETVANQLMGIRLDKSVNYEAYANVTRTHILLTFHTGVSIGKMSVDISHRPVFEFSKDLSTKLKLPLLHLRLNENAAQLLTRAWETLDLALKNKSPSADVFSFVGPGNSGKTTASIKAAMDHINKMKDSSEMKGAFAIVSLDTTESRLLQIVSDLIPSEYLAKHLQGKRRAFLSSPIVSYFKTKGIELFIGTPSSNDGRLDVCAYLDTLTDFKPAVVVLDEVGLYARKEEGEPAVAAAYRLASTVKEKYGCAVFYNLTASKLQQQEQKEVTTMASQDIKTPNPTEPSMSNTTNTTRTKPPIQQYSGQRFGMLPGAQAPFMPSPFRYQDISSSVQLQVAAASINSSISSARNLLSGCDMICNTLTQSMSSSQYFEQHIVAVQEIETAMVEVAEFLFQKLKFLETKAMTLDKA